MNVSETHSVAARRRYERCTEKLSVRGPITATLWVLWFRGWAPNRLWIYVPSMLCLNFAPGEWIWADKPQTLRFGDFEKPQPGSRSPCALQTHLLELIFGRVMCQCIGNVVSKGELKRINRSWDNPRSPPRRFWKMKNSQKFTRLWHLNGHIYPQRQHHGTIGTSFCRYLGGLFSRISMDQNGWIGAEIAQTLRFGDFGFRPKKVFFVNNSRTTCPITTKRISIFRKFNLESK